MKFFSKKINIILILLVVLFFQSKVIARESKIQYKSENISNYFLGILYINQEYNNEKALKYLKKVKTIKNRHSQFNIEFIRTFILLEKFNQAFAYSKSIWNKDQYFNQKSD